MDSSSKLYSTSSSKPMGEAVNINSSSKNNNNSSSNSGMISSSTSGSSRNRSKEMENLSYEISKYPRDLLQTFTGSSNSSNPITRTSSSSRSDEPKLGEEDDEEGLNLGLGLSLGGIFGVDKSKNMGLMRSSSIAGTMPLLYKDDDMGVKPPPTPGSNLVRTSSLPVETEEEWRKRKEMQTLRRMEAKRRRSEKQKVLKEGGGGGGGGGGSGGEDKGGSGGGVEGLKLRARLEREQQCLGITSKLIGSSMGNLFGSPKPPPPSSSNNSTNITNNNNMEVKGRRTTFGSLQGFLMAQAQAQNQDQDQAQSQSQSQSRPQSPSQSQYQSQYQTQSQPHLQPRQGSSQGSEGSQGASSDASELESKPIQGSSSCGEARSPGSIQSQQDRGSQESIGHLGTKDDSINRACGSKQSESGGNKRKETAGSSGIEDMPCVFTIGDGPHGRKVEGILYKYGKGEEVRIMCVCHGNFFSPSEFVKHAGGKDVEHPLRHIVVSPSTSAFQ